MRDILALARARFDVFIAIIGDVQGRLIAALFYLTVMLPFALIARLGPDALRRTLPPDAAPSWHPREPVPHALDNAQQQG